MSQDSEARYQEIMRKLARRQAEQAAAPARAKQDDLSNVLDGLDALGKLEKVKASGVLRPRAYGPKSVGGLKPTPWVGAVLWRTGSGYYGYKMLQIVGVWAIQDAPGPPLIVVGTKRLAYSAPTYEAEGFHKLIRRAFDLYYDGDASPPPPNLRLYSTRYAAARRLAIRDDVRETLAGWARNS